MAVETSPGHNAVALIPRLQYFILIVSVIALSACLEEVYDTPDNKLTWLPDHEETFIINPSF